MTADKIPASGSRAQTALMPVDYSSYDGNFAAPDSGGRSATSTLLTARSEGIRSVNEASVLR